MAITQTKAITKHGQATSGKNPITDDTVYTISVSPTSNALDTVSRKVYDASLHLKKAIEEMQKNYANNPNLSKIIPELPEIIEVKLPDHLSVLLNIFSTVENQINRKINELNNKVD